MNQLLHTTQVFAASESATSTAHNLTVAWPYVAFSVLLAASLVGVSRRILRNQNP